MARKEAEEPTPASILNWIIRRLNGDDAKPYNRRRQALTLSAILSVILIIGMVVLVRNTVYRTDPEGKHFAPGEVSYTHGKPDGRSGPVNLGMTPQQDFDADVVFIQHILESDLDVKSSPYSVYVAMADLGKRNCMSLRAGRYTSLEDMVSRDTSKVGEGGNGDAVRDYTEVYTYAIDAYCPEFKSLIPH